jgi:hypothetical protein
MQLPRLCLLLAHYHGPPGRSAGAGVRTRRSQVPRHSGRPVPAAQVAPVKLSFQRHKPETGPKQRRSRGAEAPISAPPGGARRGSAPPRASANPARVMQCAHSYKLKRLPSGHPSLIAAKIPRTKTCRNPPSTRTQTIRRGRAGVCVCGE